MAFGKRRRVEPAEELDTHNTGCMTGLGTLADTDAEAVGIIGDRLTFARIADNQGGSGAQFESSWVSVTDHAVARLVIEYRAATGTREFVVALRDHNDLAIHLGVIEAENSGLQLDVIQSGAYKGRGFDAIDIRGMKALKLIALTKTSGVAFDAWVGIA